MGLIGYIFQVFLFYILKGNDLFRVHQEFGEKNVGELKIL